MIKKFNTNNTISLISITILFIVVLCLSFSSVGDEYKTYYGLNKADIRKINNIIDNMTLDQKIGQLLIVGYDNVDDAEKIIKDYKIGGLILYKKNIDTIDGAKANIRKLNELNSNNKISLFISVDQEGGRVTRLPSEYGEFESAMTIGNKNDRDYAYKSGVKLGAALNDFGFNLDYAPVLDIYSNIDNTVIGDRSYGTTSEKVTTVGMEVIDGLHSKHVIATAKHFPGHGDTVVDSHVGLPIVTKTIDELDKFEFAPFKEAIKHKIDMIMTAHIILSEVDTLPSTLSSKVVTDILRGKLGYDGVVITDDIGMKAISDTYTMGDAAIKAINAGCDIVIAANVETVVSAIKDSISNGTISKKRLDESLFRILSLKYKYNLIKE